MALIDYLSSKQAFFSFYGSFWRLFVEDAAAVKELAQATSLLLAQLEQKRSESDLLFSHQQADNYRLRYWRPLTFRESELNSTTNVVSWGSGRIWGDGLLWGQRRGDAVAFAVQSEIKDIGFMVNDLADPTMILTQGVDFVLDTQLRRLTFKLNPFEDPRIEIRDVFSGGAKVDREIVIWAVAVAEHDRSVYLRHGAILGLQDAGEAAYAASVASAYKMLLQGPSQSALRQALHAVAGIRVAEGDETVEIIDSSSQDKLLIITDRNVYRFHVDATPQVAVGDVLIKDDLLADTVEVQSLGGLTPDLSSIPALVFDETNSNNTGPIGIDNLEVAVTPVDVDGDIDIEFPVQGRDADVAAFWAGIHARGAQSGRTLADIVIEWKGTLDTTINPVELLAGFLLANNAVLISLKPEQFLVRDSLGAKLTTVISRFLPPRMLAFQFMFLTPTIDTYTPGGALDEVALYGATDTIDSAGTGLSDLSPVIRSYPA